MNMAVFREIPFDYISHGIKEVRGYDSVSNKIVSGLVKEHEKLLKLISNDFPDLTLPKLRELESIIADEIIEWYDDSIESFENAAKEIAEKETIWNAALLAEYSTSPITSVGYYKVIEAGFDAPIMEGKSFSKWYNELKVGGTKRIVSMMSSAWAGGLGSDEASTLILGAMKGNENFARTLSRSYMAHMSAAARDAVFTSNDDIIESKKWLSVLDSRTTWDICGIRDQKKYTLDNKPIGHTLAYESGPGRIHWNCRSIAVPVIASNTARLERTTVDPGERYERYDNTTRTGKVRKPTKYNRDNRKFKIGAVSSGTDYEQWLRQAGNENIGFLEDVVGSKERAERFMSGESLTDISAHKSTAHNSR